MFPLTGAIQNFPWGSPAAIPEFTGLSLTGEPVAEMWFGAHPRGPAALPGGRTLHQHIIDHPQSALGADVIARFGPELPYLLKLIAPASPLSMQVHPNLTQARDGHRRAQRGGPDAPVDYVDTNHKPELVYALTRFETLCGFRAPRRAVELLEGLDHPITTRAARILADLPTAAGMRTAFAHVLTTASPADAHEVAAQCRARMAAGTSPSERTDGVVRRLDEAFPGDRGVIAALLLNPVTLQPGQVMYVPAGAVHAYLEGFGVEIMANSDNVLRAGLTQKNIDVPELLAIVDPVAAPPIRLAGEQFGEHTTTYYAPVDDFELSLITPGPDAIDVRGKGPRIILALDGDLLLTTRHRNGGPELGQTSARLTRGQAVFVSAQEQNLQVRGPGRLVQADVP